MTPGRARVLIEGMDETLRAADRDRDDVAQILREQYAEGRLTMEEYDERSTAAIHAKTLGELRALTADLPAPAAPAPPPRPRRAGPARVVTEQDALDRGGRSGGDRGRPGRRGVRRSLPAGIPD